MNQLIQCGYGLLFALFLSSLSIKGNNTTVALWTFDEPVGAYPSCVLSDWSDNNYPLALGPGGQIVEGKFGNALVPVPQPAIELPESGSELFGMVRMPVPEGRTVEPLSWHNAHFCALMTSGENHLRKEFPYARPTKTGLNLGDFDWTVEFWFFPNRNTGEDGVVFEVGSGPRAENNAVTTLILNRHLSAFALFNAPTAKTYQLSTQLDQGRWHHLAFVFDAGNKILTHYVDGVLADKLNQVELRALKEGDEDYMSIGRSGIWDKPLQGKIDELRFSKGQLYKHNFQVPGTFSEMIAQRDRTVELKQGLPLLTDLIKDGKGPVNLGNRKHLFIDDLLLADHEGVRFVVNAPRMEGCVIDTIQGSFRKHLNVVEDDDGLLRMYNAVDNDYLAVRVSRDGIHWEIPDLPNGEYRNHTHIVVHAPTGMGTVFIDPNGPPEEKWKFLTGYNEMGIFIFTSPDGYHFNRVRTAMIPCWPGSQSNIFYDDQQQKYIAYHRADFARGLGGSTQREFVYTETDNPTQPWPFKPSTQKAGLELAKTKRIKDLLPFYLDNGPLTPGGFGHEYPVAFGPTDAFDPPDTDIYVPKAIKYPWAPDTYLAFPIVYFHYKKSSPIARVMLWDERYQRGSGPLETQLSVSRDARNWKRYPRPAYVGIGRHGGKRVNTAYMAHGMIKRGDEIWQYYFGESQFHSAYVNDPDGRGVYRVVQRFDGFVSLDSDYEREGYATTKPFVFKGKRLLLNFDTDAAGYMQVGFLDEDDNPIQGFSVDDCVYLNGDFIAEEVEWMKNRKEIERLNPLDEDGEELVTDDVVTSRDVSELAGKSVKLTFRMRGAKLYSMKFE